MSYIPDAISVVIPTYNRAHLIKASIQSVLDQTLQPYEIIVVDDFSTDNTEEVVNSFNSPLIKYVKNQRKKGANGARNTGILMAKGEFIAFHDSDDIWLSEKLKLQHIFMNKNKKIKMCFCGMYINSADRKFVVPSKKIKNNRIKKWLNYRNFISTQTILVDNLVAKNIMFDEEIKRFQDWDFVLRLKEVAEIGFVDKVLVRQNFSGDGISNSENTLKSYNEIYNKYPCVRKLGPYNKYINLQISYINSNKDLKFFVKKIYYRIFGFILNFGFGR